MKRRYTGLGLGILAFMAVVAGVGAYLKYDILRPLQLYQDKSIFELPFLIYSDDYLRFMVENADRLQPTDPPPTAGSAPPAPPNTTKPQPTEPTIPTPPKDEPVLGPIVSVSPEWFDRTLFIGDSRIVGLRDYARSGNADYFCEVGMTVFDCGSKQLSDRNFPKQSLESLLSNKQYDKIFINFGLNEAGYPLASFELAYRQFVDMIRQKQPNARIILHGIMSVTRSKAAQADYYTPKHLQARSAFIASLADGATVFYVDCNSVFADSEGYLYPSLTNDGYHPTGSAYGQWRDWIAYIVATLEV